MGNFENGQLNGHFWIGMIGNGFLHGTADENGQITGPEITFIYPDGITALKGHFQDSFMIEAFNVDVEKYAMDENGILFASKFSKKLSDDEFYFDPPTNSSFGGGGQSPDPYEHKHLFVKNSSGNFFRGAVLSTKMWDLPKH